MRLRHPVASRPNVLHPFSDRQLELSQDHVRKVDRAIAGVVLHVVEVVQKAPAVCLRNPREPALLVSRDRVPVRDVPFPPDLLPHSKSLVQPFNRLTVGARQDRADTSDIEKHTDILPVHSCDREIHFQVVPVPVHPPQVLRKQPEQFVVVGQ